MMVSQFGEVCFCQVPLETTAIARHNSFRFCFKGIQNANKVIKHYQVEIWKKTYRKSRKVRPTFGAISFLKTFMNFKSGG